MRENRNHIEGTVCLQGLRRVGTKDVLIEMLNDELFIAELESVSKSKIAVSESLQSRFDPRISLLQGVRVCQPYPKSI